METQWITSTLEDVTSLIIDYRGKTPKKLGGDWQSSGIPAVSAKNIKRGSFVRNDTVKYVSEEMYERWMKEELRAGDVLLTSEAPLGEALFLRKRRRMVLSQRLFAVRTQDNVLNPRFFYYYLISERGQQELHKRATGATAQGIRQSLLREVPVTFPRSLGLQRRIASILSAYDDHIANNARRIAILEEMAQAIYREWFVYFRFPGHEDVEMVESELGMIPGGWEVRAVGDVLELAYGKALRAADRLPGPNPVYGSSGIVGHHDDALVSGPGIIVGRKGNVGTVFWSEVDFHPIDTTFFVVTKLPLRYVYYSLTEQDFIGSDTAVPGLNRNHAYRNPMLLPESRLLALFERQVNPLWDLRLILTKENQSLQSARDLLLPKLVSGEIDVSALDINTGELVA